MAEDPVCAKSVDPEQASCKSEYQGRTYYFCSLQCKHGARFTKSVGEPHSFAQV